MKTWRSTLSVTDKAAHSKQKAHLPLWRQAWFPSVALVGVYFVLTLAAYWPIYPGDPSRLVGCPCGDAAQSSWFLQWVPYAISHGHNPFFTQWINVPYGASLTQNTLMPLLGLIAAPITAIAGPVASFNVLAWLAFPLSAASLFYVLRRLQFSRLAAFVAGLLYGFSPYMVGQGEGHIMLTFVPLPPLILLTSWELLVQQSKRPRRLGLLLAAEIIAQFFIDPEVLVIAVLTVLLCASIVVIFRWGCITKRRIRYVLHGFAITVLVCGLFLAYPIWCMVSGPQHFTGPNFSPGNPYRSDLIGLIVPMRNQRIEVSGAHLYATTTADADFSEVGDYIGIILFVIVCVAAVRWRNNRWLVLSAVSALLIWIGSLGPRLIIDTRRTSIILPFAVLTKVPLVQDLLPSRLSLAEWLLVAITVAIVITEWQNSKSTDRKSFIGRYRLTNIGAILLAVLVVLTLLPRWPYPSEDVDTPNYFKTGVSSITGKTVLGYPFPLYSNDRFMLWQAESTMQFKLVGAYIQNPSRAGTETQLPPLLAPYTLQEWLAYEQGGSTIKQWPPVSSISSVDITNYIKNQHIGVVIVDPHTVHAAIVAKAFTSALGEPESQGGVLVWDTFNHTH
jgi:hypothetical protein